MIHRVIKIYEVSSLWDINATSSTGLHIHAWGFSDFINQIPIVTLQAQAGMLRSASQSQACQEQLRGFHLRSSQRPQLARLCHSPSLYRNPPPHLRVLHRLCSPPCLSKSNHNRIKVTDTQFLNTFLANENNSQMSGIFLRVDLH